MKHASKVSRIAASAIAALFLGTVAVRAEDLAHISQLLSTRDCEGCNLSDAGLVLANLSGARLAGANLQNANLSRANLQNADLRGADLRGASLFGANLQGARLEGANLLGADLREAYLVDSDIAQADISNAYIQGSIGLPTGTISYSQHYRLGVDEFKAGDYQRAGEEFARAIDLAPEYAPAYMGRALARYRLGDEAGATADTQLAAELYAKQEDTAGVQSTQQFLAYMAQPYLPLEVREGKGDFGSAVRGVSQLLLRFLPVLL